MHEFGLIKSSLKFIQSIDYHLVRQQAGLHLGSNFAPSKGLAYLSFKSIITYRSISQGFSLEQNAMDTF